MLTDHELKAIQGVAKFGTSLDDAIAAVNDLLDERTELLAHIRAQDEKLRRVTETMEAHKQCRQQCNCLELLDAILNGSKLI